MKAFSRISTATTLCLSIAASSLAQVLPGDSYHNLIGHYIQKARAANGGANGLLAHDLIQLITSDISSQGAGNRVESVTTNLKELLDIYPKMPSENQNYLAVQTINLGYRLIDGEPPKDIVRKGIFHGNALPAVPGPPPFTDPSLGTKLIAAVADAAEKGQWQAETQLNKALARVADDTKLDEIVRGKVQRALKSQTLSQGSKIEPALADLEALMKEEWPPRKKAEFAVDWVHHLTALEKITPPQPKDTPPELRRAEPCKTNVKYTFPDQISAKIRTDMNLLIDIYPTLSEADHRKFCVRISDQTGKLLCTDLRKEAEKLYWEVFDSIKIGWLDNGSTGGALSSAYPFYAQSYDLQKALKIMSKEIAFDNAGNYNCAGELNLQQCLAGNYDQMGEREEANKQYKIALDLNEKMQKDGLSDANFYKTTKEVIGESLKRPSLNLNLTSVQTASG